MECCNGVNTKTNSGRRSGIFGNAARSVSFLLLAGLLTACSAASQVDPAPERVPAPEPSAPKGEGKGWKPITG